MLDERWAEIIMENFVRDDAGVVFAHRSSKTHSLREACHFLLHKLAPYATSKKFKGTKLPTRAIDWGSSEDVARNAS